MVVLDKDKGIVKLYVDMQMPISKIEEVYGICRPYIKSVLDKNDIKILWGNCACNQKKAGQIHPLYLVLLSPVS